MSWPEALVGVRPVEVVILPAAVVMVRLPAEVATVRLPAEVTHRLEELRLQGGATRRPVVPTHPADGDSNLAAVVGASRHLHQECHLAINLTAVRCR